MSDTMWDAITAELRQLDWTPGRSDYLCGCRPHRLCQGHARQRAAEHYSPELASPICRCSHIQDHHYTDRRGRVVCRSAACGCAEFRPGGSK